MKKLFKNLYKIVPFKKELFTIIKIFPLPNSVTQHLSFKGPFRIKLNKTCSFKMFHYGYQLENELFWNNINGWEKESLKCWIKEAAKASTILDIGANTGIYSLLAKSINPDSQVYAFEPVKRVFEKLEKNIQLNSYNIKTYCEAISDKTGTSVIWDYKLEHEYAASLIKPSKVNDEIYNTYQVATISLDDFIDKYGIKKIDLIKIDVETNEPMVLVGFNKYFSVYKPVLLIEILYDDIGVQVQAFIEESGARYDYFFIDEDKGLIKKEEIRRCSDRYFNYLIVPQST